MEGISESVQLQARPRGHLLSRLQGATEESQLRPEQRPNITGQLCWEADALSHFTDEKTEAQRSMQSGEDKRVLK